MVVLRTGLSFSFEIGKASFLLRGVCITVRRELSIRVPGYIQISKKSKPSQQCAEGV